MIYFVQDDGMGHIKIGYTDGEAADRVKALQTGSPAGLVLLYTMSGDKARERELHERFAKHRLHGEWFRPAPELVQFLIGEAGADGVVVGKTSKIPLPSIKKASTPWPLKIYLAGKISHNDWRRSILDFSKMVAAWDWEAEDALDDATWPVIPNAINDIHSYVGPYFIGTQSHGAVELEGAGEDAHGVDAQRDDRYHPHDPERSEQVVRLCLQAIDRCDVLFAWIDSLDCYGTITEIGYAVARGKVVWVAGPRRFRDMWFVYEQARAVDLPMDGPWVCFDGHNDPFSMLEHYLLRYEEKHSPVTVCPSVG